MESQTLLCILGLAGGVVVALVSWYLIDQLVNSVEWLKSQGKVEEILRILQNPAKASQHPAAIRALGELHDARAIPALAQAAYGPCSADALRVLGQFGPQAIRPLVGMLRASPGHPVLAQALAEVGPAAIPELVALLHEPALGGRVTAAHALEQLNWQPPLDETGARYWIALGKPQACAPIGPAAFEPLREALDQPAVRREPALRDDVIFALGSLGDSRALDRLLALSQDPQTASQAIQGLALLAHKNQALLLPALKHPDRSLRRTAVSVLDATGWRPGIGSSSGFYYVTKGLWGRCVALGAPGVEALQEALTDPNPANRIEAVIALSEIRQPAAVEGLVSALGDADPNVRKSAVQALSRVSHTTGIPALLGALQDETRCAAAVQALAQMGAAAQQALAQALLSPDWSLKRAAASALEQLEWTPTADAAGAHYYTVRREWDQCIALGDPAVEPLTAALSLNDYRQGAAQALGRLSNPAAVGALVAALRLETHRPVQRTIVRALGKIGPPAVPALTNALSDHTFDPTAALLTLGLIGDPRAIEPMLRTVTDRTSTWSARKAAALGLGMIGEPSVGPILDLLRVKGLEPRSTRLISLALARIGRPAVPALIAALSENEVDMEAIFVALGKIGDGRALEPMLAALKMKRFGWHLRKTVIWGLGNLGPGAVPGLVSLLGDPGVDEAAVSSALIKIGYPAVDPIVAGLYSFGPAGREQAAAILGAIGDPRAIPALRELLKDRTVRVGVVNNALAALRKGKRAAGGPSNEPELEDLDEWGLE